jgi:hypothetical protein
MMTGNRELLEYSVGDVVMEDLSNQTDKYGYVRVCFNISN